MLALKNVPFQMRQAFRNTFDTDLAGYWDSTGFDITLFDERIIKSPDNQSMSDCVRERYGDKAVELIEALLGTVKETPVEYPAVVVDKYYITIGSKKNGVLTFEYVETVAVPFEMYNLKLFYAHPYLGGGKQKMGKAWGVFESLSGAAVVGLVDAKKADVISKFTENMSALPNIEKTLHRLVKKFIAEHGITPRYQEIK